MISTTVGTVTPIKIFPKEDERVSENTDELRSETREAVKAVGDARPVSASATTMSKETAQE